MNRVLIERLGEILTRLEDHQDARGTHTQVRARTVEAVVRGLGLAVGVLALGNLYFVNALTEEVKLSVLAMDELTEHFAQVAERMTSLTATVADMDRSVALMPVIRDQVRQMGGEVDVMGGSVGGMRGSAQRMSQRLDALDAGVVDMARSFRGLNRSVAGMGSDVDQLARPIP